MLSQFIDFCILLGCDYCESIRGVGPKRALELITQYKSIEKILENIDKKKYQVPEEWNYEKARELFLNPEVLDPGAIEVGQSFFLSMFFIVNPLLTLSHRFAAKMDGSR